MVRASTNKVRTFAGLSSNFQATNLPLYCWVGYFVGKPPFATCISTSRAIACGPNRQHITPQVANICASHNISASRRLPLSTTLRSCIIYGHFLLVHLPPNNACRLHLTPIAMDDSERRTVKRSRFDQTEPEPKRASRFDRRSRSPPSRRSEARDRSPLPRDGGATEGTRSPSDAAAAAGTTPFSKPGL